MKKPKVIMHIHGVEADGDFEGYYATRDLAIKAAQDLFRRGAYDVKVALKAHVSSKKREVVEKMIACMESLYPDDMLADSKELTTLTKMCERAFDYYIKHMTSGGGTAPYEYDDKED